MARFPQTRHEMRRAGYSFKNAAKCKDCGAAIEWWKTTHSKMMPFDPIANDDAPVFSHWGTCSKVDDFRNPVAPTAPAAPRDPKSLEQDVLALRDRTDARAVVLLYQDGHAAAWRTGIPAEDLRHELITAANEIRNAISKGDPQ